METPESPIIVALDFPEESPAMDLARRLSPRLCRLKVGKELFTRCGPGLVERLAGMGFQVFLDLKFHDIPNTVAAACAAAADLGVWMVNVHASGGRGMLEAARASLEPFRTRPLLIAVTVLTSLSDAELEEIGFRGTAEDNVLRLAGLARACGLDGVVCSPLEARSLRQNLGGGFLLVTPGIRPTPARRDDQRRVMTPVEALGEGADYLVIGRPITAAADPLAALNAICAELPGTPPRSR
jgi:orotidine-5'-phosphate decarboxylase